MSLVVLMEKKLLELFTKKNNKKQVKVELDLSNYATKTDLKNATDVDSLSLAKKVDLSSLKCRKNRY